MGTPNPTLYVHCPGVTRTQPFFVISVYYMDEGMERYGNFWKDAFLTFSTAYLAGWYAGRVLHARIVGFCRNKPLYVSLADLNERDGEALGCG